MMINYVFIANGNKISEEELEDRSEVYINNFCRPCLEVALGKGFNVFWGVNRRNPQNLETELPVHMYDANIYRNIFNIKDNFRAFKNLKSLIQKEKINMIHCNTPIGGVIGRVCGKIFKVEKVIYTAHGFHFYKGAPLINRTIFKGIEYLLARCTDAIITINQEDYYAASKFKLREGGKVYYVPGVGIDIKKFENTKVYKRITRGDLGISDEDIILLSVGDVNKNKNNKIVIEAINKISNTKNLTNYKLHYIICGDGPERKRLETLVNKYDLKKFVHFVGYQKEIRGFYDLADIFVIPSFREGLSRALMEAMASGLPCICSNIRGNKDLVKESNGYLVNPRSADEMAKAILFLANDRNLRCNMGVKNKVIIKQYDVSVIKEKLQYIYEETANFDE